MKRSSHPWEGLFYRYLYVVQFYWNQKKLESLLVCLVFCKKRGWW